MARVDQATHRAVWTLRADDLTLTVGSGLQAAANLKQAPARNRLHAGNMLHAPILTYSLPTRAGSLIPPANLQRLIRRDTAIPPYSKNRPLPVNYRFLRHRITFVCH